MARRKTTTGRTGFFYRASAFKMTALEAEMTQIIGESVGVGGNDRHSFFSRVAVAWCGNGELEERGPLYMEREIKGNVL